VNTETAILQAMERLMQDRTAFLVTHRPSALRPCDTLLYLEAGRLVSAPAAAALQEK